MPVSGTDEPGAKPLALRSSDASAGVPLKKRRFMLYQPSSPPSRTSSAAENDSLQKDQSTECHTSCITTASFAASSSCLSDATKGPALGEKRDCSSALPDANTNPKIQRPSLIDSGSSNHMDTKQKLMPVETTVSQLQPVIKVGNGVYSRKEVEGNSKVSFPFVPVKTELSLGKKELLIAGLASIESQGGFKQQEKLDTDAVSSNHTMSKGKGIIENLGANRSNWDLNTTMDVWEGSLSDAAAGQGTVGVAGLNETHDMKPLVVSSRMVGVGVSLPKLMVKVSEQRPTAITTPHISILQPYPHHDSLNLSLSPSFLQSNVTREPPPSLSKVVLGKSPTPNFSAKFVSPGSTSSIGHKIVKSEPVDESNKPGLGFDQPNLLGLIDSRIVKREIVEKVAPQPLKPSNYPPKPGNPSKLQMVERAASEPLRSSNCLPKPVNPVSVKSELVQETNRAAEGTTYNRSSVIPMSSNNGQTAITSAFLNCTTELSVSGNVSSSAENSIHTRGNQPKEKAPEEVSERVEKVSTEMGSLPVGDESKVSDGVIFQTPVAEASNINSFEQGKTKAMDDPMGSNVEGLVSDEEKFNISTSMLEDDSYGSDYESDGNHTLATDRDMEGKQYGGEEEEDYEDGEVREPPVHDAIEEPIREKNGDSDSEKREFSVQTDNHVTSSRVNVEETYEVGNADGTNNDRDREFIDTGHDDRIDKSHDKDAYQEESTVEIPDGRGDKEMHRFLEPVTSVGQENEVAVRQVGDENIKEVESVERSNMGLPMVEDSPNGDDAARDGNSGNNRSRIITLPRASNGLSPSKARPIPSRSIPGRTTRERYNADLVSEGEKLHPRGNRDDIYFDGSPNFSRERNQGPRNTRMNFTRGRGRFSSRTDGPRGEWDSEREFPPEHYNGPSDFRYPRHNKHRPDAELENGGYIIARGGGVAGVGRGGRKPLRDDAPIFRNMPLRRRSPTDGRGGPTTRGFPMARRMPRNIGEDGSEMVGMRRGGSEKFHRGLPDDMVDPMFNGPQSPYEGVDGGTFVRGERNFSGPRRGIPRIRSKSPIRSGDRSPGPWSSPPRRRSPDGFRSPTMYRIEMVPRRQGQGSPPFMRDPDSGRVVGPPRSGMPLRRSPSGRVLPRNTRRFDNLDPRDRIENDEFFGGPMHSGRFHELGGGDGNGDERRKFGERRGPLRPFRPPQPPPFEGGGEGENFRFHVEDGPGPRPPFRFGLEGEGEFHDNRGGNMREREFDRRIKNRPPGNGPRRNRTMEEQEGNYRHNGGGGGQVWHDEEFDDASRLKRRRF